MPGSDPSYLVLGPTAVAVDGTLLDLGPPQRRAVLARLALAPGRAVSVDLLVEALWGERVPSAARKAIQVQVSKLRALLPPGAIERTGAGYALAVEPTSVDAVRFERAVEAAVAEPSAAVRSDALRAALALWRGPALADLVDVPFAPTAAVRLEELRQQALDARVRADLALGRHVALVPELEGLVALTPEREPRWELLMEALAGAGRQADALRAYERARRHLADELGLEPGPGLRELERRVLEGDPELVAAARPAETTSPAAEGDHLAAPAPAPSLVGRDAVLATLGAALDAAVAGTGAIAVIEGDEGLGKTAVLDVVVRARSDRWAVASSRATEDDAGPYAPIVDLLHQLGAADVLAALDDPDGDASDGEARRRAVFQGAAHAIEQAAARRPVLLVVDDAHWLDEASARLLLHLARELERAPAALLVAWRPREVGIGSPVVGLAEHAAKARSARVALEPLDRSHIEELIAARGTEADPGARAALAGRVVDATGGVPLFVVDVLAEPDRAVTADGSLLPETARSITARRLTRAGEPAIEVAKAASLLAEPIALEVLADLLPELDYAAVLASVDRLLEVGLLVDRGTGPAFAHAALRAAVRSSIPPGRRQVLHANAFHRLVLEPVAAAALVQHAEGGGRLVPPSEASGALDRAGREAAARGAFPDAVGYFQRALALAPDDRWAGATVRLADALWRAGDLAAAKATAAEVADRRRASPGAVTDEELVNAVALHGTIGAGYGPDPTSIALATEALEVVVEPTAAARCASALAYHLAAWGGPAPASWAAIAEAEARIGPDQPAALHDELAFTVGLALLGSPDLARRTEQATALIARGRELGDLRITGRGLRLLGMAQLSAGDLDALEATSAEVAAIAERTASWMYESDVYRWRSAIGAERGDLDAMRAAIADLDRLAADPLAGWVMVGTQHLLLRHRTGDLDGAMAFVEAVRSALPFEDRWQTDRMLAELYRLVLLLDRGEVDLAAEELDRLAPWTELDRSSCRRYPAELAMTADAVARTGRADVAPLLAELVAPFRGQHVVLGWGEGLLGTFEDRWQALVACEASR